MINQNNAQNLIALEDETFNARLQYYLGNAPSLIRKIEIDLSTARDISNAHVVSFAFQSVYVESATDSSVDLNIIPYNDNSNGEFPLKLKDVLNFDIPIAKAGFTNSAQLNKKVYLCFILRGNFKSGSQLTEVKTSVDGSSISVLSPVVLTSTNALLIAENLNRTVLNIYADADFEISEGIGSTVFYPLPAGYHTIRNTAAIYAKSSYGATIKMITEG